jgi:hypothetical protein
MFSDLFKVLRDHFTDQSKLVPVELKLGHSKREKLWYDMRTGEMELVHVERPDNAHVLQSLEAFCQYVFDHSAADSVSIVWVGNNKATFEVIENDPKDFASIQFLYAPLFCKLQELAKVPSIPQAEAIRLLRQQFAPFDVGSKALTIARNLRIATSEEYESEQTNITARIGKSVMASAAGATDLPEFLTVTTPVYLTRPDVVFPVRVWLSVDTSKKGNLVFEPDGTELNQAIESSRQETQQFMRAKFGEFVRVYEGEYRVN